MNFLITLVLITAPFGADPHRPDVHTVATLAGKSLKGDADALARLRALGPEGLDVLMQVRAELSSVPPSPSLDARAVAWDTLIDHVARQQHASLSGLYWYTDLDAAKARAARDHKAIVSLRLLGSLDEALSCANSRFFRALLYPDPQVAKYLHDNVVLHWESVHKAPKITIDLGDGRVITRTITGNSLHYMLDAKGRVVDALPGVYGPAAFLAWLQETAPFASRAGTLDDAPFVAARKDQHVGWKTSRLHRWQAALATLGVQVPLDEAKLRAATTDDVIQRLAEQRPGALRVDPKVAEMLDSAYPTAARAAPLAISKMAVERPMLPWLRNLRGSVASDEVQNDFMLHGQIAELIRASDLVAPEPLTQGIYANVFMTPLYDPFLGLAPADVFTAIAPSVEIKDVAGANPLGLVE